MEHENSIAEEKAHSLFQVDRTFLKKILGRKSFVGQPTQTFETENVVSIPFDWEMRPGTPKHPQTETVAPITPPPSAQSETLETPTFASSRAKMSCFWKKYRKSHRQVKKPQANKGNAPEFVEFSDGNVESTSSSDHSRSSSLSSSSSSSSNSTRSSSSSSLRSFAKGLVKWSF